MLTLIYPPPAVIILVPMMSFVLRLVKLNDPASEEKMEEAISGSFAS